MTKVWTLSLGIFGLLAATPAWADRDTPYFTSLTVFGDSLVDAGNFYIATNGAQPDPAQGFFEHRFTNGYDYPDLLSLDLFGVPTTPSFLPGGGNNYGIAAARIIDINDGIPDLQAQIGMYQATGQAIDPNGLYILNFGANDVFAAKGVFDTMGGIGTYTDTTSYLKAAAEQYVAGVQTLNDLGVRNILMTDFPLPGDALTAEANSYLNADLANLKLDGDTSLYFYSISDFLGRALTNPASLGLPPLRTDTTCIAENAQATGCEGIFSFDGVHPTAVFQEKGYEELNQRFGLNVAVPEPATWAMMLVGLGAIGAAMRRRRVTVSFA